MVKTQRGDRDKKLSWTYRKKKKLNQTNQREPKQENHQKKSRIIVRNLPFTVNEKDVQQFYKSFGEIEEINLPRRPDGKLLGCGFVQFKNIQDASKAIFNTNKKTFLGRVISVTWAISKSKFVEKIEQLKEPDTAQTKSEEIEDENELNETEEVKTNSIIEVEPPKTTKKIKRQIDPEFKKQKRKLDKLKSRKKRARIIVRNLAFDATEDTLKENFSQYGEIEEVEILHRPDGKSMGCAFIQFARVQSAAKAIHHSNLKTVLDRVVLVDWAVAKNKFCKIKENNDSKKEVSSENLNNDSLDNQEIKEEIESNLDENDSNKEEKYQIDSESDGDSSEEEKPLIKLESDEGDDSSEDSDNESRVHPENHNNCADKKPPRVLSNDVQEGRTVFLTNVPFTVKNEELKQFMEQFGPVQYALVCIDRLTEHSKGTAFVKFKNIEDAENCLSTQTKLQLRDEIIEVRKALPKNDIENEKSSLKQKVKDNRNLYLVKEGVILAGTPAAVGVTATDMAKRLQLERWKSQILRNLNMFVSRMRLVIHNLPPTLDDIKLRKIIEKHSSPNAVIKEARIMRDLKNIDGSGLGKSKEYGFVAFTTHEDALNVLRNINNNPNVFTPHKRPIVAFSIENRIMVNAKLNRIKKSQERNPLYLNNPKRKIESKSRDQIPTKRHKNEEEDVETNNYTGAIGKPGHSKLRSKFNLKTQALIHKDNLKKQKKERKAKKQLATQKQDMLSKKGTQTKQNSQKINSDDMNFNKLVNNYKKKMTEFGDAKKWYDN